MVRFSVLWLVAVVWLGVGGGIPVAAQESGSASDEGMTVEKALDSLAGSKGDGSDKELRFLERAVVEKSVEPEARQAMAEALRKILADGTAPSEARRVAIALLMLVGDAQDVPAFEKLLTDSTLGDSARRGLEAIGGAKAVLAFRKTLIRPNAPALVRIGAIHSLGRLKDTESVSIMADLLKDEEPTLSAAIVAALGDMGTVEAMGILKANPPKKDWAGAWLDAYVRCAEAMVSQGDAEAALHAFTGLAGSVNPIRWRMAGLTGVARCGAQLPVPAQSLLLGVAREAEPVLARYAARLLVDSFDADAVARGLELFDFDVDRAAVQAVVALAAEKKIPTVLPWATRLMQSGDVTSQEIGATAVGHIGGFPEISKLSVVACSDQAGPRVAARDALARLAGRGVDTSGFATAIQWSRAPECAALVEALGRRGNPAAVGILRDLITDENASVRTAVWKSLGQLAEPKDYAVLVSDFVDKCEASDRETARKALLTIGARIETAGPRVAPILESIQKAPSDKQAVLFSLLAAYGGPDALQAVEAFARSDSDDLRLAATRALSDWSGPEALDILGVLATTETQRAARVLAIRGFMRLLPQREALRADHWRTASELATDPESKRLLLSAASTLPTPEALAVARAMMDDADVRGEALIAVMAIAEAGCRTMPQVVMEAMEDLEARADDAETQARARSLYRRAQSPVEPLTPAPYALEVSQERRRTVADDPPQGVRLAAYLDCGYQTLSEGEGPVLRQETGSVYVYPGSGNVSAPVYGTVAYENGTLTFSAKQFEADRHYALSFAWWDYDNNRRAQSVWLIRPEATTPAVCLLPAEALPPWQGAQQPPKTQTVYLGRGSDLQNEARIEFRREGSGNVVVSELCLWAMDRPLKPDAAHDATLEKMEPPVEVVQHANVLIVTGMDYPAHLWYETTPALVEALRADSRLDVRVVEDPHFLSAPVLDRYDVIIMNWMNHEQPAPGEAARENLRRFVEEGGGMVLIHFACGAFQDWPAFVELAGRVYDPKLRPHDPYGTFSVVPIDQEHPITKGLTAFDITDELYTCLAGAPPIQVLAHSRSKVDGKDYPMAFVLTPGKGRVFHCPLGHDAQALRTPGAAELIRRGVLWSAGLTIAN